MPHQLCFYDANGTQRILTPGWDPDNALETHSTRLPAGHPEGYLEAFANLYRGFADRLSQQENSLTLPSIEDGMRGLQFVQACLASSEQQGIWINL